MADFVNLVDVIGKQDTEWLAVVLQQRTRIREQNVFFSHVHLCYLHSVLVFLPLRFVSYAFSCLLSLIDNCLSNSFWSATNV